MGSFILGFRIRVGLIWGFWVIWGFWLLSATALSGDEDGSVVVWWFTAEVVADQWRPAARVEQWRPAARVRD